MVKAVIFDMDGLMIDTEKLLVKYWLEAARYYGYQVEREQILGIRSLAAKYAVPKLQAEIGEDFDYYKVRTLRIQLMNEHIEAHGLEEKQGAWAVVGLFKRTSLSACSCYSYGSRAYKALSWFFGQAEIF